MKGPHVSKKLAASTVLVVALLVSASSCSESNVSKSKFRSELVKKTDLTSKQATCVVDKAYSSLDQSEINDIYTAADTADLGAGLEAKFVKLLTDCVVEG